MISANQCRSGNHLYNGCASPAERSGVVEVGGGVAGLGGHNVFSAPVREMEVTVDWKWPQFAAAIIGNSEFHPPLHYHCLSIVVGKGEGGCVDLCGEPLAEELDWLREMPALKRVVTLASPCAGLPGIDMREDLVAASAVDLVVAQLHRNERGVPIHPTTLLLEGEWKE